MKITLHRVRIWLCFILLGSLALGACSTDGQMSHLNVRNGGTLNRDEAKRTPGEAQLANNGSSATFANNEESAAEAEARELSNAAAQAMEEEENGSSNDAKEKRKEQRKKKSNQRGDLERQENTERDATEVALTVEENPYADEEELLKGEEMMVYVVRGRVVNSKGKPIAGMQIALLGNSVDATPNTFRPSMVSDQAMVDTTDVNGAFIVRTTEVVSDYMRLFVRDIDGPSKGNYKNDVINVTFGSGDVVDSGHGWRHGTSERTLTVRPKLNR